MFGPSDITCPECFKREQFNRKLALRKHLFRKAFMLEFAKARKAGKVIVLWEQDEVTGIHYRRDSSGQYYTGGRGRYNV